MYRLPKPMEAMPLHSSHHRTIEPTARVNLRSPGVAARPRPAATASDRTGVPDHGDLWSQFGTLPIGPKPLPGLELPLSHEPSREQPAEWRFGKVHAYRANGASVSGFTNFACLERAFDEQAIGDHKWDSD